MPGDARRKVVVYGWPARVEMRVVDEFSPAAPAPESAS